MNTDRRRQTEPIVPLARSLIQRLFLLLLILAASGAMVNYKYLVKKSETQFKEQIREYITQRGRRESELFSLARDNLLNLRKTFLNRALDKRNNPKTCNLPNPLIVNHPELGISIPPRTRLTPEARHRVRIARSLILEYGPAWKSRLENLWFMGRNRLTMTYWPDIQWTPERASALNAEKINWFDKTDMEHNPGRGVVWTGLYFDALSGKWLITAALPVDMGTQQVGTVGTDLECRNFFYRNLSDSAVSSYSMILSPEGRIIVHPYKIAQCISSRNPSYTVEAARDPHLTAVFKKIKSLGRLPAVVDLPEYDEILAVTRIDGPGWYLVSVFYKSLLSEAATEKIMFATLMGLGFLLISLLAAAFLVQQHISDPLHILTRAAEDLNAPKGLDAPRTTLEHLEPHSRRRDEVGVFMRTFIRMGRRLERLHHAQNQTRKDLEDTVRIRTRDLERAKQTAEAANLTKTRFLANMSHELRTPLNVILGFSHLMEKDPDLTPEQKENLGHIHHSGDQLLALIDDVLDMSKIESGKTVFHGEKFHLAQLLEQVAAMFRHRAREKALTFTLNPAPELPAVIFGDKQKLRQVLTNLLSNAMAYTAKGSVTLTVSPGLLPQAPSLNLMPLIPDQWIRFAVKDTGPGIARADMATLFNHFTTAARTRKSGTGLGLAISRNFVRIMGGELDVTSRRGQGATFYFDLPVQVLPDAPQPPTAPRPLPTGIAPNQTVPSILLVEDHTETRLVFTKLLKQVGFTVHTAENGRQGLAQFKALHPDVVLMDIRMPVMDGMSATRKIKALDQGKSVPVIALTAHAFESEHEKILAAGCDAVIRKPLDEAVLFDTLARFTGVAYLRPAQAAPTLSPRQAARLKQACIELDQSRVLEEIQNLNAPELARQLKPLAQDFRFEEILGILNSHGRSHDH